MGMDVAACRVNLALRALALLTCVSVAAACDPEAGVQPLPAQPDSAQEVEPPRQIGLLAEARPDGVGLEIPDPRRGPPYPIILVHGFSGFNRLGPLEYFFRVIDALQLDGEDEVFAPALPPYNSVEERAPFLAAHIDEVLRRSNRRKVHLIAHSQGGLDARRVISALGYADRVATLTTVATPHHGTPVGDYILGLPAGASDPVANLLAWLIGAIDDPDNDPPIDDESYRSDMEACAESLSIAGVEAFNAAHPDPPGVPIFSVAGVSNFQRADGICALGRWGRLQRVDATDPLLYATAAVLSGWNPLDLTPNDGMLPTASMVWGTFLGCIPADHFDEIGQISDLFPNLFSGFNHVSFYRGLVADLRQWEQDNSSTDEPDPAP